MAKQIIPREQWERFFAGVSREYQGKSATLEVLPENVGPQLVAYDQTFGEIGVDEHGAEWLITILLGETFTHTVDMPLRVYTEPYASSGGTGPIALSQIISDNRRVASEAWPWFPICVATLRARAAWASCRASQTVCVSGFSQ